MRSLIASLFLAGSTVASAALADGQQAGTAPDPKVLEHLVKQDCGSCHGLTLKGGLGPGYPARCRLPF